MTQDTTPRLDDKYTTGVWYDTYNGDFCTIQRGFDPEADGSGRIVELVNPENGNVYWDMPVRKWVAGSQSEFRPVSDEAVEDPVGFVREAIDLASTGEALSMRGEIALRYARQQVEISEK